MKNFFMVFIIIILGFDVSSAKKLTYNQLDVINLCDQGIPSDERSTHILIPSGDVVYGATSGLKCHVFRFDTKTQKVTVLATIEGPNTIMKGMVLDGTTVYFGTMLTKRQLWWIGRKRGGEYELDDANLYQIDKTWKTGHLYRITGVDSSNPKLQDLGIPVSGQGIQTIAMDKQRGLIYGLTYPTGRFFIYDTKTNKTETITFGNTTHHVSNHMVQAVEVVKDLTDFTPGGVEFNIKYVTRAMHVMDDGVLYTSGWDGQIIQYDPDIAVPRERFTAVAYLPSVPGRQHWNALDEIIEYDGLLYMAASDGYIFQFDPETNEIKNYGKPISSVEVMGMTFSSLDGLMYGISGGVDQGISRFWCLNPEKGVYKVDYPAVQKFNLKPMADIVCTRNGTIVMAETERIANLWVLTPGTSKEWEKSGVLSAPDPMWNTNIEKNLPKTDLFKGHKKLEVDIYPIPSTMHGGSGFTAIQADNEGKIYVGGAYYGKFSPLMQLDPKTAAWRLIFRSDELTHEYGRGQGICGKIHTKLRLGKDGKIYGAMKQGYEFHFALRSDMGEAPYGKRGGQYPCHFFSYDPKSNRVEDLGPGFKQEGTVGFCADTDRGYLYGMTEPSGYFLVYNLKTGRFWNAGPWGGIASNRYMAIEHSTGRVYHKGEITPSGRHFMVVWDPEEFRLRDYEIVAEEGLKYTPSYVLTSGQTGSNKLYGGSDGKLWEMDMIPAADGKLHVRPICTWSVDGEPYKGFPYAIETGPDGCIYWANLYNNGRGPVPTSVFVWDPVTETKTYLGSCALDGKFIKGGLTQGICFDRDGNMGIHILYANITPDQQRHLKVGPDFTYKDIEKQPWFTGYPGHVPGSYYSVYYIKNATSIQ